MTVGKLLEQQRDRRPPPRTSSLCSRSPGIRIGRIALVLWLGLACAGPPPRPVPFGMPVELAEDEGLLVVQVDSEIAIESLWLDRVRVSDGLPSGQHLWLIVLKAGDYRWKEIRFGADGRSNHRHVFDREDDYRMDVVAGHINYPGELVVRTQGGIEVRNRNHAGMAVRRLQSLAPGLIRSIPLRHAGASGDTFLDSYRRKLDASPVPTPSAEEQAMKPGGRVQ